MEVIFVIIGALGVAGSIYAKYAYFRRHRLLARSSREGVRSTSRSV